MPLCGGVHRCRGGEHDEIDCHVLDTTLQIGVPGTRYFSVSFLTAFVEWVDDSCQVEAIVTSDLRQMKLPADPA